MTSQDKQWYSGHEILNNDIHELELLDAVKAYKLTPYTKSRKKVIDVETAERMWICRRSMTDEKIKKVWRQGEYYNEDSEQSLVVDCLADFDIEYNGFFLPNVLDYNYKGDEVRAFFGERINGHKQADTETNVADESLGQLDQEANSKKETPAPASSANFFTRKGKKNWHIGFMGKDALIMHINGLLYIAYLLQAKPGKSISCQTLYQAELSKVQEKAMSEGTAIDEGLGTGRSTQVKSDQKAKSEYLSEIIKLEDELLRINDLNDADRTAEDEMVKEETEKSLKELRSKLKEKNFADEDTRAQNCVTKGISRAYTALRKEKMNELADHLQQGIRGDGRYGLVYTGNISWQSIP